MQASYSGMPMSQFKAGDLCEVVDHPLWTQDWNIGRQYIGLQVILIRLLTPSDWGYIENDIWLPRWVVAGGAKEGHSFSEKVLRKIEPPALDEEESQDLELVV